MKKLKFLLICTFILSQTACGNDDTTLENPSNNIINKEKVEKGKVVFTMKSMVDGNDKYRGDGCATKMLFINGLGEKVSAKIMNYDVIHTIPKMLHTGRSGKKSIMPNDSKISKIFIGGLSCKQITGLKIHAVSCTTESGTDCSDKLSYRSTDKVKMVVDLWK